MKRRFVAAMLAGVMACSLAGCNTKSPMAGKEKTATAPASRAGLESPAAFAEGETCLLFTTGAAEEADRAELE